MTTNNSPRPVLFLDFDDVLCLNKPYGGYDVLQALSQVVKKTAVLQDFKEVWEQLFAHDAKAHLQALHDEFSPCCVLSTSWRNFMNKEALAAVLKCCDLDFVASYLHRSWETPISRSYQIRAREISNWLGNNHEFEDRWVALDDERSGTGFAEWPVLEHKPFIVLCRENVGLTLVEYAKLREAFLLRATPNIRRGNL